MIARLHGTTHRLSPGSILIDVQGVGYDVSVPTDVWEQLKEGDICSLWISTYVREDRLELYGFMDQGSKAFFEQLISLSGIGPRMGLEICSVPRSVIVDAAQRKDHQVLGTIKGIGKKKAEKLLVELAGIMEREPHLFGAKDGMSKTESSYDQDAVEALSSLGYDTPTILATLKELPQDMETTEERVTAALRSL